MTDGAIAYGFSDAAQYVQSEVARTHESLRESAAFGIEGVVQDELATLWDECRHPNWDGFGAAAVTQNTLRYTYRLLESIPFGLPRPSISAEPDGNLTLEWHRSPRRTLSVSVTAEGDLHYAALLGPNRTYGTEAFFDEFPETILNLIRRVGLA